MEREAVVLAPGLVLLRGFLDLAEQLALAAWAMKRGHDPACGWYKASGALNCGPRRGRVYSAFDTFVDGAAAADVCKRAVAHAQTLDTTMPGHDLTHLLLLRYLPSVDGGDDNAMIWHRDNDPNDGDNNHPVVSLSLGCSSYFGYKVIGKPAQQLLLESGDVLLFGGPSRLIEHCVHRVLGGSGPPAVQDIVGDARINFTFRDAPSIRGQEAQWQNSMV